jgi:hypothetical protein
MIRKTLLSRFGATVEITVRSSGVGWYLRKIDVVFNHAADMFHRTKSRSVERLHGMAERSSVSDEEQSRHLHRDPIHEETSYKSGSEA